MTSLQVRASITCGIVLVQINGKSRHAHSFACYDLMTVSKQARSKMLRMSMEARVRGLVARCCAQYV